jgi:hypothetical protein
MVGGSVCGALTVTMSSGFDLSAFNSETNQAYLRIYQFANGGTAVYIYSQHYGTGFP